eukprot:9853855-Lingulodinium_polyedra.AAC.1
MDHGANATGEKDISSNVAANPRWLAPTVATNSIPTAGCNWKPGEAKLVAWVLDEAEIVRT